MIEAELKTKLTRIFEIPKVTFDTPSESAEQDTIFVVIDSVRNTIKELTHLARVTGRIRFFAPAEKVPYGFFSKQIAEASPGDTVNFFFYDFEENSGRMLNIVERSLAFVYFYSGQYDPDTGVITDINLILGVTE